MQLISFVGEAAHCAVLGLPHLWEECNLYANGATQQVREALAMEMKLVGQTSAQVRNGSVWDVVSKAVVADGAKKKAIPYGPNCMKLLGVVSPRTAAANASTAAVEGSESEGSESEREEEEETEEEEGTEEEEEGGSVYDYSSESGDEEGEWDQVGRARGT